MVCVSVLLTLVVKARVRELFVCLFSRNGLKACRRFIYLSMYLFVFARKKMSAHSACFPTCGSGELEIGNFLTDECPGSVQEAIYVLGKAHMRSM